MTPTPIKPPTDDRYRVFRGGGWTTPVALWVRATCRSSDAPAYGDNRLGFRCAQRCRQQILKVQP